MCPYLLLAWTLNSWTFNRNLGQQRAAHSLWKNKVPELTSTAQQMATSRKDLVYSPRRFKIHSRHFLLLPHYRERWRVELRAEEKALAKVTTKGSSWRKGREMADGEVKSKDGGQPQSSEIKKNEGRDRAGLREEYGPQSKVKWV